ncbi:MAG: WD40/YVTN/BNR-like repeat-containing protein [Chitinophagaceae bacterium]
MRQLIILLFLPVVAFAQTPTTGAQKLAAFKHQQLLLQQSPYKNIQWRLTGPDNRSGRSTDVIGITGNPNIIYAAYATGGLWKTEDAGETWKPIFDKEATQSIGNIALAPSNPDILYVGTGEANIFRASLPGTGMYKSTNGGKNFTNIGLQNSGTISRVVVHPKDPNRVYAGVSGNEWTYNKDRGVYLTNDGGKSWKNILFESDRSGCIDLVMDPSDANTLYASMWNRIRRRWSDPIPEGGDHIYKTTDGGKTWKIINKARPDDPVGRGLPDTKLTGRIGLAVSISNPNVLYAFVDDHNKKRDPKPEETDSYQRKVQKVVIGGAIYRSNDKGENWQKMGEIHDFFTPFSGTYGWVFGQIRVDPKNENEVYAMGVSMGKSEDGGKTWKKFEPSDKKSDEMYGDNHAMWFDKENPDRIILGNDGGVSFTNDGGNIWKNTFKKIPTTQFYNVTYDMEQPFNLYGSIQDQGTYSGNVNNTFGKSQDSTIRSWNYAPGGEGTRIEVDPTNHNMIFSSSFYGRLMKSDFSKPQRDRSKPISLFAVGAIDSLRGEWLAGTLMSRFNNKVIYHGLQHLYKSEDGGDTWKIISHDLSYNDRSWMGNYPYLIYHQAITTISEGSNPGKLYVGTDDGRLWNTMDDGKTWNEIIKGLPYNKHVANIEASVLKEGKLYVVLNDRRADNATPYVFVSDNSGVTWRSVTGNLPASPVNVIIEDDKTGNLFCGTDLGIYISKDGGKKWLALNADMPASVSVQDMFIHPRDRKLVIATYGRGVYCLDDMNVLK